MKKAVLTLLIFMLIIQAFGQLNPINNLYWNHTYENPNNCFALSWEKPDTSYTDTLIGYNIYRDTSLYRFTTDRSFSCNPCIGDTNTSFCDFINILGGFTIRIKAVYNSSGIESGTNDSAICYGIAIGMNGPIKEDLKVFPNPTIGKLKVEINGLKKILVLNEVGAIVLEINTGNEVDLSDFARGVYFLKVFTDNGILTEKIVLH